jgi:hypothetical protein
MTLSDFDMARTYGALLAFGISDLKKKGTRGALREMARSVATFAEMVRRLPPAERQHPDIVSAIDALQWAIRHG